MDKHRCSQVLHTGPTAYTSDGHRSSSSGCSQKLNTSNALLKSIQALGRGPKAHKIQILGCTDSAKNKPKYLGGPFERGYTSTESNKQHFDSKIATPSSKIQSEEK